MMEITDLIRQMEKVEKIWPDERPWSIQILATSLQMPPADLLSLFKNINNVLESEKDQVLPEDMRLLRAYCETLLEHTAVQTHHEDQRRAQVRARRVIDSVLPKINLLVGKKEHEKALKSYLYLLGEASHYALPEERASWYEDMARLSLKLDRPRKEAARYLCSALDALAILEDAEGMEDLLAAYKDDFTGKKAKGRKADPSLITLWQTVVDHYNHLGGSVDVKSRNADFMRNKAV